ncbi:MAG: 2-oxoacid:acceptor oxidoreductase subunit alpha [Bdellovibrionales bacterium]|nr:2-oxoacid:acceptor oxidoreductase subunit alpha [Bdellovibrionales bacterium]
MGSVINDFTISVATVNGSGSQSANNILMRSIFRMGVPVEGKNIFPSNIAGLPTWFSIRVSDKGYTSRKSKADIFIAMNKATCEKDLSKVRSGGLYFYSTAVKLDESLLPDDLICVPVDFNQLAGEVTQSIQLKKLLVNMVYVGLLAELLKIPEDVVNETVKFQFKGKESVFKVNQDAVSVGRRYAQEHLQKLDWPFHVEKRELTKDKILIDGNTASALGLVYAGCSFASWYPITPSSSLAESFESFCEQLRVNKDGEHRYAMVQAEDELAAISMVAGAGWAGGRAMTATSGPGISLMAEAIGLMYFAEIPGVIWDVQRMGPSTGLPTRTSQGDVLAAARLSHGDTRHPIFFPSDPAECFEFANLAFDLSERAQTPVFVLTDLDLGMNFWMSEPFQYPKNPMDRGKVLNAEDLKRLGEFARYKDVDGDGIPYRTLPGTPHDLAAYFTRGTGHDPKAEYSEDNVNYQALLNRLDRKWQSIQALVPPPDIKMSDSGFAVIYFGSTDRIMEEFAATMGESGKSFSRLRLKAYPFHKDVTDFIRDHKKIFVLEQNQSGQMRELLSHAYPQWADKFCGLPLSDGMPLSVEELAPKVLQGGLLG